jgi:predicted Holliday junction resolvase-like endonuclease
MANIQIWMPYFASTMAIVVAIFVAAWLHNKHIDSLTTQFSERIAEVHMRIGDTNRRIEDRSEDTNRRIEDRSEETNRRIEEINRRIEEFRAETLTILRHMQGSLEDLDHRVTRLEERSAPIVRS